MQIDVTLSRRGPWLRFAAPGGTFVWHRHERRWADDKNHGEAKHAGLLSHFEAAYIQDLSDEEIDAEFPEESERLRQVVRDTCAGMREQLRVESSAHFTRQEFARSEERLSEAERMPGCTEKQRRRKRNKTAFWSKRCVELATRLKELKEYIDGDT